MSAEESFDIKPLSFDVCNMLDALAHRKDVKVTYYWDSVYDTFRIRTLDQKHLLVKVVREAYNPCKYIYKYNITLGNGELVSQGYVNNTAHHVDNEDIDKKAEELLETLSAIAGYNETHPSLLTRRTKGNDYILQYVRQYINPGARTR